METSSPAPQNRASSFKVSVTTSVMQPSETSTTEPVVDHGRESLPANVVGMKNGFATVSWELEAAAHKNEPRRYGGACSKPREPWASFDRHDRASGRPAETRFHWAGRLPRGLQSRRTQPFAYVRVRFSLTGPPHKSLAICAVRRTLSFLAKHRSLVGKTNFK
jgi:hypothetical protein